VAEYIVVTRRKPRIDRHELEGLAAFVSGGTSICWIDDVSCSPGRMIRGRARHQPVLENGTTGSRSLRGGNDARGERTKGRLWTGREAGDERVLHALNSG
jgi:hypothetical protein